jgi:GR25 family glycosyltransferase involved in LPS biosynthesis
MTSPASTTSPPAAWDAIDAIFCITLADRPDRRRAAEAQFAKAGLASRVQFHTATRHPTNSEQGIFESHLACLRQGLAANARTILVFEDDVLLTPAAPATFSRAAPFLAANPWDILFLGCFVKSSRSTPNPVVRTIRYRAAAHAYLVNRPFAERLVSSPWQNTAYDDFIRSLPNLRALTLYPAIAFQSNSPSDNRKTPNIDRFRRLLGGIARLQRLTEWSHRHAPAILLSHIAAILLLLLLLFLHFRK